jgi:hypothetical protein
MPYTTQELIEILERELRATWKGERIVLSSAKRLENPVLSKVLDLNKVSKVFAYRDFRCEIHAYQQQHQVSGIIWRGCNFRGKYIEFPELHNQLIAVSGDKEILTAAKESILSFWREVTENLSFWLTASFLRPITNNSLEELIQQAEWAELDATQKELYLGLCWGNPQEYQYQWAKPDSGLHRIIAATDEPNAIKLL